MKTTAASLALSLALYGSAARAASSSDWLSRSIYQVLTDRFALTNGSTTQPCDTGDQAYCGGSFQGIINHLDYIQGMGFDAIWISPITEQLQGNSIDGEAYHGYWQQNLYNVNSAFGSESDLQALSSALHDRGMYLMVDVVFNHFAWLGNPSSINYADFNPFSSASYFHGYCPIDYNDTPSNMTNIQDCWEGDTNVPLVDLCTECSDVASMYQSWIQNNMIPTYSIDGFRVDSVLEMNTNFWPGMLSAAGDTYMVGEVDYGGIQFTCGYQDYIPGVLNYPMYYPVIQAFESTSGSISNLVNSFNTFKSSCSNTSLMGTFTENHDVPRFAQLNSDMSAAQNVIAYTMLADGIPIIYEGQEQHYNSEGGSGVPWNREAIWLSNYNTEAELYQLVATLNKARKAAIAYDNDYFTYQTWPFYSDDSTIGLRKSSMIFILSNLGSGGSSYSLSVDSGLNSGTAVTELLTCATQTTGGSGSINVPMASGLPRIYYPTAGLSGSGLCGH